MYVSMVAEFVVYGFTLQLLVIVGRFEAVSIELGLDGPDSHLDGILEML